MNTIVEQFHSPDYSSIANSVQRFIPPIKDFFNSINYAAA